MSERENQPGAFPFVSHGAAADHQYLDPGMTLRDYAAIQFAAACISTWKGPFEMSETGTDIFCKAAYQLADAMLKAGGYTK